MTEPLYPEPLDLDQTWAADTVAVQAGRPARVAGAPMNAPITLSSTYVHDAGLEYGRDGNSAWGALEAALGALDGGQAVTFASGLAAATAIADLVPPRRHRGAAVGGVLRRAEHLRPASGTRAASTSGWSRPTTPTPSWRPPTAPTWSGWSRSPTRSSSSPMSPRSRPARASAARSPWSTRRSRRRSASGRSTSGADIVLHSATKLIAGHSDLLLGAAVCRDPAHADFLATFRHDHGAIPGAFDAFLALRGLRTLAVRLDRAEASAAELARRLAAHPHVARVNYPGLPGDPQHERASRVLPHGSGRCCRSRSPAPSSRPRRSSRGCAC